MPKSHIYNYIAYACTQLHSGGSLSHTRGTVGEREKESARPTRWSTVSAGGITVVRRQARFGVLFTELQPWMIWLHFKVFVF